VACGAYEILSDTNQLSLFLIPRSVWVYLHAFETGLRIITLRPSSCKSQTYLSDTNLRECMVVFSGVVDVPTTFAENQSAGSECSRYTVHISRK
jgi:hypothetical protein